MVGCLSPLSIRPGPYARADERVTVPCGKCIACRLNHSRDWATRIVHEASLHAENSFLTLTYSDEHLPDPPSLHRSHVQGFFKRLRERLSPSCIRFFYCGEYGTATKRPHYHAIVFGEAFRADRYPWQRIRGNVYYRSPLLEQIWTLGHSTITDVTPKSANYVARYSVKKANDYTRTNGNPYERINVETGQLSYVKPEFIGMSTKPGIGFDFVDKYSANAFPSGFFIIDGKKVPVPRAYKKRLLAISGRPWDWSPDDLKLLEGIEEYTQRQHERAIEQLPDNTPERTVTKAEILRLRMLDLKRELE